MEFELEERSRQFGEDDALDIAAVPRSPQLDRVRHPRPPHSHVPHQDQAVLIPEQEAGSG